MNGQEHYERLREAVKAHIGTAMAPDRERSLHAGALAQVVQEIEDERTQDQPGGKRALTCGCSCPADQPQASMMQFVANPECPLHGIGMLAELMNDPDVNVSGDALELVAEHDGEEIVQLLRDLTGDELETECRIEPISGNCIEHMWLADGECAIPRARRMIDSLTVE